MKPISDQDQFEAGRAAFLADDDHLLYQCTPEFLAGYKAAFEEHAPKSEMDPHGEHVEEYWKAHYSEAVTGMRERLLNAVLGVGAAVIVAGLLMAPWLFENAEVAGVWR